MKHNVISDRNLYKYYSINMDNLNAIYESKIWLSHPSEFNDPFDASLRLLGDYDEEEELLKYAYDYLSDENPIIKQDFSPQKIKNLIGIRIEDPDGEIVITPAFTETFNFVLRNSQRSLFEFIDFLREKMKYFEGIQSFIDVYSNVGITSFATEAHDPKMWASYGDNHKGVCVVYELNAELFNASPQLYCCSVRYENGPYRFEDTNSLLNVESKLDQLSLKSKDWVNEKEVRLISLNKTNQLLSVNGLRLKAVCFGLETKISDQKVITKLLSSEFTDISFYKADLNDVYCKINWKHLSGPLVVDFDYQPPE